VESREGQEKDRRSEVVRDIGRDVDTKVPGASPAISKNSSIKEAATDMLTSIDTWPAEVDISSIIEDPMAYERASRYVAVDFSGAKPIVTIFNTKTLNLKELQQVLFKNVKIALLSDVGSVLMDNYLKGLRAKEPEDIKKRETPEGIFQALKDLLNKIVTTPSDIAENRGGVRNKEEAEAIIEELLDFSEGEQTVLLEKAFSLVEQLSTEIPEEHQEEIKKELEKVLEELKQIKQPIAEKMRKV
jgi:hypothetical protein